jgi:hypothetical protein
MWRFLWTYANDLLVGYRISWGILPQTPVFSHQARLWFPSNEASLNVTNSQLK